LSGGAGNRLDDEVVSLELARPEALAAGQTWRAEVETKVPAPMLGRYSWQVAASGAGDAVVAVDSVGTTPWALLAVLFALLVDAGIFVRRRLAARRGPAGPEVEVIQPRTERQTTTEAVLA
jgi:hypothetical protein